MSEATYDPVVPVGGGGAVAPFSPAQPLVPVDNSWDVPQPDFLNEHHSPSAGGNTFLGRPLTAAGEQQVTQLLDEITTVFQNDMAKLGISKHLADAAENWYRTAAFAGIPNEAPNHHYSLGGIRIPAADLPWAVSFLNYMNQANAPESFVKTALWWYGRLCQVVQNGRQSSAQTSAPNLSRMSSKQQEAEADRQIQSGLAELQMRWHGETNQRLALIRQYLAQFPKDEVVAMEQKVLPNGHLAGSDPDYICYLYQQAVGGNLPTNSAAVAAEINKLENYMRTNRKAYIKDEPAQARLRLLYEQRGH